jgi:hypothetical protein
LIPQSQTRFRDPRGPQFEFDVDAQGRVVRAFLDQQGQGGVNRTILVRQ